LAIEGNAAQPGKQVGAETGLSLSQALRTPAFWVFGLATSLYGLASSGISLFNVSILQERGFTAKVYYDLLPVVTLVGLAFNFLGGWLAGRWPIGRVLGVSMLVQAAALWSLPHLEAYWHVVVYSVSWGAAGGVVTVVFFTFWGVAYGRRHLGRIQGLAQMLTVLASAVGPLLLALCKERTANWPTLSTSTVGLLSALQGPGPLMASAALYPGRAEYGSYQLAFYTLAPLAAVLGLAAWRVRLPRLPEPDQDSPKPSDKGLTQGESSHAGHPD
jgi:hypothetical protein